MKKTYFIDRINNYEVSLMAESIDDLQMKVAEYCFEHIDGCTKIYVHCSHVVSSTNTDEQNVEYIVRVNNQARTITTRRL